MPELSAFWSVVVSLLGAAAVYGGIRADLRSMRKDIDRAHVRVDEHIDFHLKGRG